MLRLTLDTACVIDAAQGGEHSIEIDHLVALARAGGVGLWLTSAFDADQSRASDENYQANLLWLSERPLIRYVPGPFRFDLSEFNGPDLFVTDEIAAADEKIKLILRPSYRPGDAFPSRKINDVHHLTAHLMAAHDRGDHPGHPSLRRALRTSTSFVLALRAAGALHVDPHRGRGVDWHLSRGPRHGRRQAD